MQPEQCNTACLQTVHTTCLQTFHTTDVCRQFTRQMSADSSHNWYLQTVHMTCLQTVHMTCLQTVHMTDVCRQFTWQMSADSSHDRCLQTVHMTEVCRQFTWQMSADFNLMIKWQWRMFQQIIGTKFSKTCTVHCWTITAQVTVFCENGT